MGSHIISDVVAPRVTELTVNKLGVLGGFSAAYKKNLSSGKQPNGDTQRIKKPHMANIRDGFNYQGQGIDRRYVTVTADQKFGADLDWDTIEEATEMERSPEELEDNLFNPMSSRMAQEWDLRAMRFVKNQTPNVRGALGTTPTTLATYTAVRTCLIESGGWETATKKNLFLTPEMMGTIIAASNNILALFNPKPDVEDAFREGYVGKYGGFKWLESMSCQRHTTGVITTQLTGTTISGGGQSGVSINLAGSSTDTLLAGDTITIANVYQVNPMTKQSLNRLAQFKIATSVTFSGSAATVTLVGDGIVPSGPYQNVDSVPADAAIVLIQPGTTMVDGTAKSGLYGAAFTDEAFGFVAIDLPMPKEASQEYVSKYTDPKTGMTMGLWRHANFEGRSFSTRLDTWGGFGNLQAANSACLIASLN